MARRWIEKIGLVSVQDGRLLVVRKRGGSVFILPGGKKEGGETDLEALRREVDEELGCTVHSIEFEGVFKDLAAEIGDAVVVVRLYSGRLVGTPSARSEIEELHWVDVLRPGDLPLAPSIVNGILPHMRGRMRKSRSLKAHSSEQSAQGLLEIV